MPSRRVRQHVNPLQSSYFDIKLDALHVPAGVPVEVELGSAEAWYLFSRAREAPQRFYVGIEIRREVVEKANQAGHKQALTNVQSIFANMSCDLPRLFPPGRVARYFVNFPDPWWKTKQQKRRVVSPELVNDMMETLAPDGEIYVATDIFGIALDAMAALEDVGSERLVNVAGPWSFMKNIPFAARSRREDQCLSEGTPIWRLGFRKQLTAA